MTADQQAGIVLFNTQQLAFLRRGAHGFHDMLPFRQRGDEREIRMRCGLGVILIQIVRSALTQRSSIWTGMSFS